MEQRREEAPTMSYSDYMPTSYPDFASQEQVANWTGRTRWNAVYTVQLGELIEKGVFSWELPVLNWSEAAYTPEQYARVCKYFQERFMFREISIEPFYEWANMLHYRLSYELMPKYRRMYKFLDDGFDFAQDHSTVYKEQGTLDSATSANRDDYAKRRAIGSDYPETLLSGNSDYASNGQDEESEGITEDTGQRNDNTTKDYEEVERGNLLDAYLKYEQEFRAIDQSLLDELEPLFIGLYTASIDGM